MEGIELATLVTGVAGFIGHHEDTGGSEAPHRLYNNIGNNRAEELTRLIELIVHACGRKAVLELLPMQPGDVYETFTDIGPIRRDLGYRPTTEIDEGVPRFVEWFRNYAE